MRFIHKRRHALATATIGGLALLVSSCAPSPSGSPAPSDADKANAIKIGVLRVATGPLAANGKHMENGWNLYWELNGTKIGDKEVQTIFEDTAGDPAIALNKANRLVTNNKVDMLVGPLTAAEGLAVADAMNRQKVVAVMPIVSADDITQRLDYPTVVRLAGWTSSQTTHPFGEYVYDLGHKKVLTIGADYAFGYEGVAGFANTFTDKGGTISKQLWAPLGTQDYSSYIASIQQDKPDAVFEFLLGADQLRFFKAYKEFGLYGKIPLLGGETTTDQSVLQGMGPDALGMVTSGHFAEGRDDPATRDFVDAFYKKYNKYPSYYSAAMYTAARGVAEAIKSMNGDISNRDALVKALKSVNLSSTPMGPLKIDERGNPILNVYVRKVEKGPHGLWNVPVKTYPAVSQFWTYNVEEFLKHPVYSKTYQGIGAWPSPAS